MAKKEKSLMRQLIEERGIKDVAGVQALVKELTAGLIQECMDAEMKTTSDTASMITGTRKRTTAETALTRRP